MAPPLALRFVQSADRVSALPASPAEVAFVGRSNVGKSSLVNALAASRKLAHVSNTPGRTRLLNLFDSGVGTVVDLPGYGYAAASKTERAAWQEMIERYLLEREALRMVLVLVDGEIGPTSLDVQMLDWLRAHRVPHTVVATKQDKVKASKLAGRRTDLARKASLDPGDVVWVSAAKHAGIDRLRDLVRLWLS